MSVGENARASGRRSSLYAVTIEIGDRRIGGRIQDHSERGCRIRLDEPVRADDRTVTVVRGGQRTAGAIAWRGSRSIGVSFDEPPPENMFAPSMKIDPSAPRSRPSERFRRPGLGPEAPQTGQADAGRRWSQGDPQFND
jgi:hypothetical protein